VEITNFLLEKRYKNSEYFIQEINIPMLDVGNNLLVPDGCNNMMNFEALKKF